MKDLINILEILSKYKHVQVYAEHDVIYFALDIDLVSRKHCRLLRSLGCYMDEGFYYYT